MLEHDVSRVPHRGIISVPKNSGAKVGVLLHMQPLLRIESAWLAKNAVGYSEFAYIVQAGRVSEKLEMTARQAHALAKGDAEICYAALVIE
jgi:hypothetical protein